MTMNQKIRLVHWNAEGAELRAETMRKRTGHWPGGFQDLLDRRDLVRTEDYPSGNEHSYLNVDSNNRYELR